MNEFFMKHWKKIAIGAAVLFSVLIVILACIEPLLKNKIVIKNKSSHKISALKIWYEDEEGPITEVLSFTDVSGKKITRSIKELGIDKFLGEAWITIEISFEDGGNALLQTSHFLNQFEGKLDFEISNTKTEEVKFHVQASEGLFNSTATTGCDDIYYINPTNGYIE
jgi:hypothetical protein